MKHLLLIANISMENKYLLEYASNFCNEYNCKLHVLHASHFEEPVLVSSAQYYEENDIEYVDGFVEKTSQNIAEKVTKIHDKDLIQVTIQKGNQEKILSNFLSDNFIDLIIVGTGDLNKVTDFQNHKNILLNVIDTPLLVVPELQIFSPFNSFNFLTTHSDNDIENIVLLSDLFSESSIKVTHMGMNETQLEERQKKWEQYISAKVQDRLEFVYIEEEVSSYIKREKKSISKMCDALVFTTKKRNFWSRLLDPSTTIGYLTGLELPSIIFKVAAAK